MKYEKRKVWGVLLRLFHWAFVLSIVALTVTGIYVHNPWTNTVLEGTGRFPLATMRYIHFVAGFVLTGAILTRIYLLVFGNRHEKFLDFIPVTPRNIKNFFATLAYYLYLSDKYRPRSGHNALAGSIYLVTFFLALGQILTGFYLLYPENLTLQGIGLKLFGTQQQARFIHHLLMWYFILYAFTHIYILIWNDIKRPQGLISSIFNGTKFKPGKV